LPDESLLLAKAGVIVVVPNGLSRVITLFNFIIVVSSPHDDCPHCSSLGYYGQNEVNPLTFSAKGLFD
jgi:hypothetical protein